MPKVPREAYDVAWRVACSYGELIPDEAERLMSVSGLTPHMALNRAQVETIVHRVAPLLIAAGRAAAAADIRAHLGPDPSPASPTWWVGYTEALSDAARLAEGDNKESDLGSVSVEETTQ